MKRDLQQRDINDPIARIVCEWASRNDVSALRYSELTQDLQAEVTVIVHRAINQGFVAGRAER